MSGSILSALSLLFAARQGLVDPHAADASLRDIVFTGIDGDTIALSAFAGQTLVIVNTASNCGFREQMDDLQRLQQDYRHPGLQVLCLPSDDFWHQEPGDEQQIREIYRSQLNVAFPLTQKIRTRGARQHPFFQRVSSIAGGKAVPKWNFYKYVIDKNGRLAAWFATPIKPSSPRVRASIDACL